MAGLLPAMMWAQEPILIKNATILTVTKGTINNGSILLRDGKIVEVGTKVNAPANAKVIDATGKFVIPGIIDCHSHIATEAVNEGTLSVSSMVGIEDTINPEDLAIYRALAGGVTTANILHGSANSIGGENGCIENALGEVCRRDEVRRRNTGHQVRVGGKSQAEGRGCGHARLGNHAALPGHAYRAWKM